MSTGMMFLSWVVAESLRAARLGYWGWDFKPATNRGIYLSRQLQRDPTLKPDGTRDGHPQFRSNRWFQIAKQFDRAWGQMEGIETTYKFAPPQNVKIFSLTLMQPTPWSGRKDIDR